MRASKRNPLVPELPLPKRPFRDSAVFNGLLALLIVGVAWWTGGSLAKAIGFAVAFFVIATAWSWWRFRARLEREASGQ